MQSFRFFSLFLAALLLMTAPVVSPAMGGFKPSGNEPSPFFGLGAGKRGRVVPEEGKVGTADRDVAPNLERVGLSSEALTREERNAAASSTVPSASANATNTAPPNAFSPAIP